MYKLRKCYSASRIVRTDRLSANVLACCALCYTICWLIYLLYLYQLSDFLPVLKLYDLLYPDNTSIIVPDWNKANSTHVVAATCIWIHLNMKASTDNVQLQRPIPHALREHQEALGQLGQHLE